MMTPLTLCLTRVQSAHEQPCAVCGAEFVPRKTLDRAFCL
jgi:hypothetical protein